MRERPRISPARLLHSGLSRAYGSNDSHRQRTARWVSLFLILAILAPKVALPIGLWSGIAFRSVLICTGNGLQRVVIPDDTERSNSSINLPLLHCGSLSCDSWAAQRYAFLLCWPSIPASRVADAAPVISDDRHFDCLARVRAPPTV